VSRPVAKLATLVVKKYPTWSATENGSPLTAAVVQQIPANVEPNRKRAAQFLSVLDRSLASRRFLAGEALTIADISALCTIDFATMVEIRPDDGLAHVARWHAEMSARPSAQA